MKKRTIREILELVKDYRNKDCLSIDQAEAEIRALYKDREYESQECMKPLTEKPEKYCKCGNPSDRVIRTGPPSWGICYDCNLPLKPKPDKEHQSQEYMKSCIEPEKEWCKHIIKEGSREHVVHYDSYGKHCSEPNCEINKPKNPSKIGFPAWRYDQMNDRWINGMGDTYEKR